MSTKELILLNCGAEEDSWKSLGQQGDQSIPWTARRSKQSILKDINPEYSLEALMLKLQILWSPDVKSRLIGKDPDAGKDRGQEEKGATENEMVGWHHWLNGHEFEQTPGDSEGQGSLVCCSSWGSQRVRHDLATEKQQSILSAK